MPSKNLDSGPEKPAKDIVFFDGVCHLCNFFVDWVVSKDSEHQFYFASLQGQTAKKILPSEEQKNISTVIVYHEGLLLKRSEAVFHILSKLPGAFHLLSRLQILPRSLTDFFYLQIAKNRLSWFGQRASCRLPTSEEKNYLLD